MPTLTSTKFWPGNLGESSYDHSILNSNNLGKSTNVALVMAQLWSQGKCYGPHSFWVQIRDFNTHEPAPGVTVGDIGTKIGINSNDNGYLRLDHVRIPRRHMLMGHAKVLPDGTYKPPIHSKVTYSSMMFIRFLRLLPLLLTVFVCRSYMIMTMGLSLAQTACIAIRYSTVRRQGTLEGSVEV